MEKKKKLIPSETSVFKELINCTSAAMGTIHETFRSSSEQSSSSNFVASAKLAREALDSLENLDSEQLEVYEKILKSALWQVEHVKAEKKEKEKLGVLNK